MNKICSILFFIFVLTRSQMIADDDKFELRPLQITEDDLKIEQVNYYDFPFVGLLVKLNKETGHTRSICMVSLLNNEYALTSASCFCNFETGEYELNLDGVDDRYWVYFGLNRSMSLIEYAERKVKIGEIYLNGMIPSCNSIFVDSKTAIRNDDMAIIRLRQTIRPSRSVGYIEILDRLDEKPNYIHLTTTWVQNDMKEMELQLFKYPTSEIERNTKYGYFFGNFRPFYEATNSYSRNLGEAAIVVKNGRYFLKGYVSRPWRFIPGCESKCQGHLQCTLLEGNMVYNRKFNKSTTMKGKSHYAVVRKPSQAELLWHRITRLPIG